MNFFILSLYFIAVLDELIFTALGEGSLTAVNGSHHAAQLYLKIRTSLSPTPADPATSNANTRKHICEEITNSDYFKMQAKEAVSMFEVYEELKQKKYRHLFNQLYRKSSSSFLGYTIPSFLATLSPTKYDYVNEYAIQKFVISGIISSQYRSSIPVEEHVFLCLVRKRGYSIPIPTDLLPYYVSKEYNVFVEDHPFSSPPVYIPGRFIFKPMEESIEYIALAEKPSSAYVRLDYNVELHYLQIRKHYQPVENGDSDPICKLIPESKGIGLFYNQHERLCVSALGSLYFKGKVKNPNKSYADNQCYEQKISFQTEVGKREALGEFYEWMIFCEAVDIHSDTQVGYYISRAYRSNQVFVSVDSLDRNVYLENFSTNISVVDQQ